MERVLYLLARGLLALLQRLPLRLLAWLGRRLGGLAYWLDLRHRRVARHNLELCFGAEKSSAELRALARENFRRIGEAFACAARTAGMKPDEISAALEVAGVERLQGERLGPRCGVIAIGHFGNFEVYAKAGLFAPGYQFATTYRALRQPLLNRLLQDLRERSGCLYFERRTEAGKLRQAMNRQRLLIGFLADQHAGNRGLWLPFFGKECSTSSAPAVFALRYDCPLHVAVCYRVAPARWRIELGGQIPTRHEGRARSVEEISLDLNRAFEVAIRRDPANWFWVHNRWKEHRPEVQGRPKRTLPPPVDDSEEPSLPSPHEL